MQLIERVTRLLSMMPPGAYELLAGAIEALISSPASERMGRLRKMALAAGYKQGARLAMNAALRAKAKL